MPLITAAIALISLLAADLKLSKTPQGTPSPIGNAIAKLVALAALDPQFVKPDSVVNILQDLQEGMKAAAVVLPDDIAIHLEPIQSILDKAPANIANIANGQAAILGDFTESINGKAVKVDVFAIQQNSKTNVATDLGLN